MNMHDCSSRDQLARAYAENDRHYYLEARRKTSPQVYISEFNNKGEKSKMGGHLERISSRRSRGELVQSSSGEAIQI